MFYAITGYCFSLAITLTFIIFIAAVNITAIAIITYIFILPLYCCYAYYARAEDIIRALFTPCHYITPTLLHTIIAGRHTSFIYTCFHCRHTDISCCFSEDILLHVISLRRHSRYAAVIAIRHTLPLRRCLSRCRRHYFSHTQAHIFSFAILFHYIHITPLLPHAETCFSHAIWSGMTRHIIYHMLQRRHYISPFTTLTSFTFITLSRPLLLCHYRYMIWLSLLSRHDDEEPSSAFSLRHCCHYYHYHYIALLLSEHSAPCCYYWHIIQREIYYADERWLYAIFSYAFDKDAISEKEMPYIMLLLRWCCWCHTYATLHYY